ncbi:phosphoglycerate mutase family domain protein [Methylocaldum marinum]|uniref:Phosphoglycerate mutase family domain protein n=1 Tax=Methylocaldum marinum TaxID=1432792 RepID=A0A250KXD0_9GAMM|nr:histidine phosphatase family protein [Methylocaldum marinum]BBA36338.1 phosphoglycerate mutase family domain protein [Methylocaldum marinum]
MKNLIIIRHAKAEPATTSLGDIDRPLNDRGKRDALLMGGVLKARGVEPDVIVSSPARRAAETAERIAEAVGYDSNRIAMYDSVYLQEASRLFELIRSLDDVHHRAYLIGHNPHLSELVARLTGEGVGQLPTCGVAAIEFAVDAWAYVMEGSGRLVFLEFPKQHP